MQIKRVDIGVVLNSRLEEGIEVSVNGSKTSAPSGKSTGKHEVPAYNRSLSKDIKVLGKIVEKGLPDVNRFDDLKFVEDILKNNVGANTLFALEASILKALAKEQGKELFQIIGKGHKIPKLLSNTIGGGAHTNQRKKPDFQEFLVIGDKKHNIAAYKEIKKILKTNKTNDENACISELGNETLLELLSWGDVEFGIDVAASEFYNNGKYKYKNPKMIRTRKEQIGYMIDIIKEYKLSYVEDPMDEDDFKGFSEILRATTNKCLIVGDDLTTTNLVRVKKAIQMKAINGLIVKPNQIGSLVEVKKVAELCKRNKVKIIVSHRSGETTDNTIADLAVGLGADMIKIPVFGKERLAKVNRLEDIKKAL